MSRLLPEGAGRRPAKESISATAATAYFRSMQTQLNDMLREATHSGHTIQISEPFYYDNKDSWQIECRLATPGDLSRLWLSIDHLNKKYIEAIQSLLIAMSSLAFDSYQPHNHGFCCHIAGASPELIAAYEATRQ